MKKKTRRLAQQVKQALLDLPAPTLLDTVDTWLRELDSMFEDGSLSDGLYQRLGYRAWSGATQQSYASLDELYAVEPEETVAYWEPPTAEGLQETLCRMQPATIYHTVVALAADVLGQKAFAIGWGEPPGGNHGYAFMLSLTHYLALRRAAAELDTAQFETRHEADLEAISPPEESARGSGGNDGFAGLLRVRGEGTLHFRVVFSGDPTATERRLQLLRALEQYQCLLPDPQPEDGILLGSLPYSPQRRNDLKTLVRVRRLLTRWQRLGWITWTSRKEKPARQKRSQRKGRRRRRRQKVSPIA